MEMEKEMGKGEMLPNSLALKKEKAVTLTKEQLKHKKLNALISSAKEQIKLALPQHMSAERMARIALTTIKTNPKLIECSEESIFASLMLAAQLGLEPGVNGHCYFVPYWNKTISKTDCQFQIGYRGLMELARRSGQIKSISARAVYSNDKFNIVLGLDDKLEHEPCIDGERGEFILVYSVAKFNDGGHHIEIMTISDIEKIKALSKSKNKEGHHFGPWADHYEAMALKTVLKRAAKYWPISSELQQQINQDEKIKKNIVSDMIDYQDNEDEPFIEVVENK